MLLPTILGDDEIVPFLALFIVEVLVAGWQLAVRLRLGGTTYVAVLLATTIGVYFSPLNLTRMPEIIGQRGDDSFQFENPLVAAYPTAQTPAAQLSAAIPVTDLATRMYKTDWAHFHVETIPLVSRSDSARKFRKLTNPIVQQPFMLPFPYIGNETMPYAAVAVHDIDRDGLLDVVIGKPGYLLRVYRNLGEHKFADMTAELFYVTIPNHVEHVYMVDLNGDQFLDIITMHSRYFGEDQDQVRMFNPETGKFSEPVYRFGKDKYHSGGLAVVDWNNDGLLDFYSSYGANWYATQGFSPEINGHDEFHLSTEGTWQNQLSNVFPESVHHTPSMGMTVFMGDLNDDRVPDFLLGNDLQWPSISLFGRRAGDQFMWDAFYPAANCVHSMSYFPLDVDNDGVYEIWENCISYPRGIEHPLMNAQVPDDAPIALADLMKLTQMFKAKKFTCELIETELVSRLCAEQAIFEYAVRNNQPELCTQIAGIQHRNECMYMTWRISGNHDTSVSRFFKNLNQYPVQLNKNILLKKTPSSSFVDVIDGDKDLAAYSGWTWAGVPFDVNMDGLLDVLLTNGFHYMDMNQTQLLMNESNPEDIHFMNRASDYGVASWADSRGAVFADLDMDGDGDLVVGTYLAPTEYYENKVNGQGIVVYLRSKTGNYHGLGSTLYLETPDGQIQKRQFYIGGHWGSSPPLMAMLALPDSDTGKLRVVWPDSEETVLEVEAGFQYVVYR